MKNTDFHTQIDKTEILNYILFVILKRKYMLIAVMLATFSSIIFFTFLVTPTWEATTKILVERSSKLNLNVFEDVNIPVSGTGNGNDAVNLLPMLTGDNIAYDIAREFKLDELEKRKKYNPGTFRDKAKKAIAFIIMSPRILLQKIGILSSEGERNWLDKAAKEFIEDWQDIKAETESSVINITIYGEKRELAMNIANRMVGLLKEKTQLLKREDARNTHVFIGNQILLAEKNVRQAENELTVFKEKNNITMFEEEKRLKVLKLTDLVSELDSIEEQLAALLIEKQGTHPEVLILMARKDYLSSLIRKHKSELKTIPEKELELDNLQEILTINTSVYLELKSKLEGLEIDRESSINEYSIRVLDKAYVSPGASYDWPSWILSIIAGIIFSCTFGFGSIFILEFWNDSISKINDIEKGMSLPCIGIVPEYGRKYSLN